MLNAFYQPSLLEQQLLDPQHHLLVAISDEKLLGYSHCIDLEDKQKISKLYILPDQQGLGIGKKLIEAIEKDAIAAGVIQLELCVNRGNPARYFYEKMGFDIIREEDFPVGDFWMNDYVMQKNLSPKTLQP
jgi:GNAT superfamily N-acetyltransferase